MAKWRNRKFTNQVVLVSKPLGNNAVLETEYNIVRESGYMNHLNQERNRNLTLSLRNTKSLHYHAIQMVKVRLCLGSGTSNSHLRYLKVNEILSSMRWWDETHAQVSIIPRAREMNKRESQSKRVYLGWIQLGCIWIETQNETTSLAFTSLWIPRDRCR